MGHTKLQSFVGLLYGPLRFFCKICLAAPLTTRLSPRRWIILNLVVDILFTRVQISTFPFIDGFVPFLLLLGTEVLTLLWRYYGGIDRLALWWAAIGTKKQGKKEEGSDHRWPSPVHQEFGNSFKDLATGCFSAPISHISELSLHVRKSKRASLEGSSGCLSTGTAAPSESTRSLESEQAEDGSQSLDVEAPGKSCAAPEIKIETRDIDHVQVHGVSEEMWEQRPLYHILDAIGSTVGSSIVRLNQQLSITLARNLPIAMHLDESFQTSAARWNRAQVYAWVYILFMLVLLGTLGGVFFVRIERLRGDRRLTLSRVMSYLYRDHFWFFFLWLAGTGGYVAATMIKHFGADFTLHFSWLGCSSEDMKWPNCFTQDTTGG